MNRDDPMSMDQEEWEKYRAAANNDLNEWLLFLAEDLKTECTDPKCPRDGKHLTNDAETFFAFMATMMEPVAQLKYPRHLVVGYLGMLLLKHQALTEKVTNGQV